MHSPEPSERRSSGGRRKVRVPRLGNPLTGGSLGGDGHHTIVVVGEMTVGRGGGRWRLGEADDEGVTAERSPVAL